jgi:hypothetical protein
VKLLVPIIVLIGVTLTGQGARAECCRNAVAVVRSLSGQAIVHAPDRDAVTLSSLEWLEDKSRVEVRSGSITLVLVNGFTYELRAGSRGTVTAEALTMTRGNVHRLASLPPIPAPAPLADRTLRTGGALRIRGTRIRGLYPNQPAHVLAEAVNLSFLSIAEASSYVVELLNEKEQVLLREETQGTRVAVPPELLKPSQTYSWRVQAMASGRTVANGAASFSTLSAAEAASRMQFVKALPVSREEAGGQALLAEIDLRLGLVSEAVEGLRAAQRLQPSDPALQRALQRAERSLGAVLEAK